MKLTIYRCDHCGEQSDVNKPHEVFGVHNTAELFASVQDYPLEMTEPGKCLKHVCIECVRVHVDVPAENFCRKALDRDKWQVKRAELSYLLRKKIILG